MSEPPDPKRASLFKTRLFLVIFFGAALALSATTILGTWRQLDELPPVDAPETAPAIPN